MFIGGRWQEPSQPGLIEVVNPATAAVLGVVPAGGPEDAGCAVEAAVVALPGWRATPAAERAGILRGIAAALTSQLEELAALITSEVGSPLAFSRVQQVGLPIQVLEAFAAEVPQIAWSQRIGTTEVVREPVGVVGAITPWNYPLHQVVAKVGAALAAGCTIVVKPSELAPFSALALADIASRSGVPDGVINVVTGYGAAAGEAIAAHPGVDMVSLTGSGSAGRRVMELAAPSAKRVALELGGKSATVVLDDADFDAVIPGAVMHAFRNSGQNCSALSRLIVPRDRLAQVEQIAVRVASSVVVGDPRQPGTEMGPLISAGHRDRVAGMIRTAAAGADARLIAGGPEPPGGLPSGFFVAPTVFSDVDPASDIAQDEVFGPVLCIIAANDEDDAVRIANSTRYGLSGAVWSADAGHARSVALRMRTGRVVVNGGPFSAYAPFGGYRQSGFGSELGRYGIEEFLTRKTLQLQDRPAP
jgi:acyl-CoA reductase-like NAD-dependent aldehyde dehydrogenase